MRKPLHKETYFAPQETVDKFVEEYPTSSSSQETKVHNICNILYYYVYASYV